MKMSARQFKDWQKTMGWSVSQTARHLCVHERQIYLYRSGETAVPPWMVRLCHMLRHVREGEKLLHAVQSDRHQDGNGDRQVSARA